jgi:hypothetical protein
MTKYQNDPSPEAPDQHSDAAAIAPIWVLLLALIVVIEIGFLPVTRSILATVLY